MGPAGGLGGAKRVAKLYTRTGDDGETGLAGGMRVRKNDARICAIGAIDELNAHLGLAITSIGSRAGDPAWQAMRSRLCDIQADLFSMGAELATPPESKQASQAGPAVDDRLPLLEAWIDEASAAVPALTAFVLPGGDVVASHLHLCRTVCRRAERSVVTLGDRAPVEGQTPAYLNRLSDLLFAWARLANHLSGVEETKWPGAASDS
jgi:cob(I)alamin adenosyltransferase